MPVRYTGALMASLSLAFNTLKLTGWQLKALRAIIAMSSRIKNNLQLVVGQYVFLER